MIYWEIALKSNDAPMAQKVKLTSSKGHFWNDWFGEIRKYQILNHVIFNSILIDVQQCRQI